jgi:hypothetical protein
LTFGQFGHGGGADVRALGVAEEDDHDLALEVGHAALLAIVVGQAQILGVVSAGDVDPAKLRPGLGAAAQKAKAQRQKDTGCCNFESVSLVHGAWKR